MDKALASYARDCGFGVPSGVRKKQSCAAEACWAHNPEVDGSKSSSASLSLSATPVQVSFHKTQSETRMRSTAGGFQWATRSQFHTQPRRLSPSSQPFFLVKSSLQLNRRQTGERLANPESCKFNE